MDINSLNEIIQNYENKPNKDLLSARNVLVEEFDKTKELILSLTRHLDSIEEKYNVINNEIGKRNIK
jgi:hypothetical protein